MSTEINAGRPTPCLRFERQSRADSKATAVLLVLNSLYCLSLSLSAIFHPALLTLGDPLAALPSFSISIPLCSFHLSLLVLSQRTPLHTSYSQTPFLPRSPSASLTSCLHSSIGSSTFFCLALVPFACLCVCCKERDTH